MEEKAFFESYRQEIDRDDIIFEWAEGRLNLRKYLRGVRESILNDDFAGEEITPEITGFADRVVEMIREYIDPYGLDVELGVC